MLSVVNVTVRMDETVKKEAEQVFNALGLNMSTAFNVFARAVARQRKIPFELSLMEDDRDIISRAKNALKTMQDQSIINGTSEMSMEEIDIEIAKARKEKREQLSPPGGVQC